MSRQAWTSIAIFAVLLVVVIATRQDRVRVGIRELALPVVAKGDVTGIEIAGKHKAVLKRAGEGFTVADPSTPDVVFPAEQAQVDRVLEALETLEAGAFVSGRAEKHDDLEVTSEKGTILRVTTSKGTALKVVLGRFAKGGGNYVRLEDGTEVFVTKSAIAGQVKKDVEAWRDKKILDVPADAIREIVVTPKEGAPYTIVHEKTGEGEAKKDVWKLKDGTPQDEGFRVDGESLSRLARSVGALRAAGFVDDKAKTSALAWDGGKVELTLEAGEKKTIALSSVDADKKVAVRVDGNAQIFSVTEFTAKSIAKPLAEHRDLSLFVDVAVDDVSELRFIGKDLKAAVKREGDAWRYEGPDAAGVDVEGLAAKLTGVLKLRAASLVGPEVSVKPKLTDTLRLEVVTTSGTVHVVEMGGEVPGEGGAASSQVYATRGDGLVYAIGKFQKTRHEKPGELFKRVERPAPGGMGGGGGIPGLDQLPPEIRKQLEQQLKAQGM